MTAAAAAPDWRTKVDHRLLEGAAPAGQALSPLPPPGDAGGRRIVLTLNAPLDDSRLQALHDSGFLEEIVATDRLQVQGRIAVTRLPFLAALDFVRWIAPVQPPLHK
jgi:hypothetical protein